MGKHDCKCASARKRGARHTTRSSPRSACCVNDWKDKQFVSTQLQTYPSIPVSQKQVRQLNAVRTCVRSNTRTRDAEGCPKKASTSTGAHYSHAGKKNAAKRIVSTHSCPNCGFSCRVDCAENGWSSQTGATKPFAHTKAKVRATACMRRSLKGVEKGGHMASIPVKAVRFSEPIAEEVVVHAHGIHDPFGKRSMSAVVQSHISNCRRHRDDKSASKFATLHIPEMKAAAATASRTGGGGDGTVGCGAVSAVCNTCGSGRRHGKDESDAASVRIKLVMSVRSGGICPSVEVDFFG